MTSETENLVLEILKRLQADVAKINARLDQVNDCMDSLESLPKRVDAVERQLAGLVHVVGGLADAVTLRLEQHDVRLQTLEAARS